MNDVDTARNGEILWRNDVNVQISSEMRYWDGFNVNFRQIDGKNITFRPNVPVA